MHVEQRYPPPKFGRRVAHGRLRLVATNMPSLVVAPRDSDGSLGDLDALTLETFADRYLSLRDELALRRLRGDALEPREAEQLDALNAALDRLLPAPPPLPREVLDAVEEAERLKLGLRSRASR